MKLKITAAAVLLPALVAIAISQTAPPVKDATKKHHVIFQITTENPKSWEMLFGNISNAQKSFGAPTMEIEVVAYGPGINILKKTNSEMEASMKKAVDTGVVFAVCQNSMRSRKVTTEDLFPFAAQVDSGVAEIIRKQEAGFSYIRATDQ